MTERLLLLFSETRLAGEVVVVRMVRVVGVEGIAVEVEVEIVGLLFGVAGVELQVDISALPTLTTPSPPLACI